MSFSKAKIQRFNDPKDCTPSPAKYNVSIQEKIKLGIISKPESYVKRETSSNKSETGSVHSTPCFQTPTVPLKKKKLLGISFRARTQSESKITQEELLREKTVECNNKDLFIQDLTEQIEELTASIGHLKKENERLNGEKSEVQQALVALQEQRAKDYRKISEEVKEVSQNLKNIRQLQEDLKCQSSDYNTVLIHFDKFQDLYDKIVEQNRALTKEFNEKEEEYKKIIEELKQNEEKCRLDFENLQLQHAEELGAASRKLQDSDAKIQLLEENLRDVTVLTQLQMKEKIEEVEGTWKDKLDAQEQQLQRVISEKIEEVEAAWTNKLQAQEKEAEAILKECQEISEYNIIQCEVEKNRFKNLADDAKIHSDELAAKNEELQVELNNLKSEKHAYELSISTFKDTIEVLKRRLINSDRDVEQLKEEVEKCEEKILKYEQKCAELESQLSQTKLANEELEMQYESTSKLMQNQVEAMERELLRKVDQIKEDSEACDKELVRELMERCHEQQILVAEAQNVISQSTSAIEVFEHKQVELETELKLYKLKLDQESEEAAEIRKKYIEKSGKYDELAHQFEQILQELDQAKGKIHELDSLVASYQQQLETYQTDLQILVDEKQTVEAEVEELRLKYADIVGHQNHNQKIRHLQDLKTKTSELFNKNVDLEAQNHKLSKTVDKLLKEIEDLKKLKKNKGAGNDKENMSSPKCCKNSPGPLKAKN